MNVPVHHADIRVFSKQGDDEEKVKSCLLSLFPFSFEDEKIRISQSTADGFEGKIRIFAVSLSKKRLIRKFTENLLNRLTQDQKKTLLCQKERRLDKNLDFFIRLDKKSLLENRCSITDSGSCFHIKLSIAAFPAKRENAFSSLCEMFK